MSLVLPDPLYVLGVVHACSTWGSAMPFLAT